MWDVEGGGKGDEFLDAEPGEVFWYTSGEFGDMGFCGGDLFDDVAIYFLAGYHPCSPLAFRTRHSLR